MKKNRIKKAIHEGKVVTGVMVSELKTTMIGLLMDAANVNFAIIDMEHGAYSNDTLSSIINGFNGVQCVPFVRVPSIRREYFLAPLELGAMGVLVPRIESKEDAQRCVHYSKYSPEGDRGVSSLRAHTAFKRRKASDYMKFANENIMVMVQIETGRALDNLDDILSTEGIDVAFVGPSDIGHSLKIKEGLNSPKMIEVIDRIIYCAKMHDKVIGIHVYDPALASIFIEKGIKFISCNTDVNALISGWSSSIRNIYDNVDDRDIFFRNNLIN